MPSRKIQFANNEYYHIYNRGVDKRTIFEDAQDFNRFLGSLDDFNSTTLREEREFWKKNFGEELRNRSSSPYTQEADMLVEVVCFCLNENHFHFILKQLQEKGIEKFMQKIGTGYTNYFNIKQKRSGSLFQGKFKAIHIDSNDYLLYLSAYVNLNHFIHNLPEKNSGDFGSWPHSSFADYIGINGAMRYNGNIILSQFSGGNDYKDFAEKNALYMKEKKSMQKYLLEE